MPVERLSRMLPADKSHVEWLRATDAQLREYGGRRIGACYCVADRDGAKRVEIDIEADDAVHMLMLHMSIS